MPVATLKDLLADPPLLHGPDGSNDLLTHGLLPPALAFIEAEVNPGDRTLETGSGLSTIVFALRGADHLSVVPQAQEETRFQEYCAAQGIDASKVRFDLRRSEDVLPTVDLGQLDLVLIDGSHSFPQVFIDFFYTQRALKTGGWLVVDDVHVWTGRVLRDFLIAEPEWELVHRWQGRTVAFRKLRDTDPDKVWVDQAYVTKRTAAKVLGRARMTVDLLREGDVKEVVKRVKALAASRKA